ncbi:hypothetical protein [Nocardia pneumoniae]|uniref:hypothetical protein n=1 Tax=Nocardia pneumoniae TaxID=228601 RepID=UPI0012F6A869|nr:hypothetical protein [Nocardia pneumoniae]
MLLMTIALLVAVIVALVAGAVGHVGGKSVPNCVTLGGGEFYAAMSLTILVLTSPGLL